MEKNWRRELKNYKEVVTITTHSGREIEVMVYATTQTLEEDSFEVEIVSGADVAIDKMGYLAYDKQSNSHGIKYHGGIIGKDGKKNGGIALPSESYQKLVEVATKLNAIGTKELEENDKHIIKFRLSGWEVKNVRIDTRKDIDEQLKPHLAWTGLTLDGARAQYKKALDKHGRKEEIELKNELSRVNEALERIEKSTRVYATEDEASRARNVYNDLHNEGGEGYAPEFWYRDQVEYYKSRKVELVQRLAGLEYGR